MPPGAQMTIGSYRLTHQTFDSTDLSNYKSERATIAVDRNGKQIIMLYPEQPFYPSTQQSGTMVAIYSPLTADPYVVYAGHTPETTQPVSRAALNPLLPGTPTRSPLMSLA